MSGRLYPGGGKVVPPRGGKVACTDFTVNARVRNLTFNFRFIIYGSYHFIYIFHEGR